jgi:hypothetical protein
MSFTALHSDHFNQILRLIATICDLTGPQIPMALLLRYLPRLKQVELDAPDDAGDAGLGWLGWLAWLA